MNDYILRIEKDDLEKQIFSLKSYYSGVERELERGSTIFLLKETESGDAFVGYGIIKNITTLENMSEEEKDTCTNNNWNKKLSFGKLVRFEPPLLVTDTVVSKLGDKGALQNGAQISQSDKLSVTKKAKVKITL
ncbi:MAG: hypothetical protein ACE5KA_05320 [Nitrososphaerales archaeon]